ncbi:MAG: hypothetical protein M0Z84_14715 [Gammaproteobacteria bacterium]|nr:hypothetical protein [Gammaproteobacteria bacterium]
MILTHDYPISEAFDQAQTLAPIQNQNVERHKTVMTGVIPLTKDDEGFEGLGVRVDIRAMYFSRRRLSGTNRARRN